MNPETAIEAILPNEAPRPGASRSISATAWPRCCNAWAMLVPMIPAPTTAVLICSLACVTRRPHGCIRFGATVLRQAAG